jgi:hypothetical protein
MKKAEGKRLKAERDVKPFSKLHSPAPWVAIGDMVYDAQREPVCMLEGDEERREVNRRLIQEAPMLYAVCRSTLIDFTNLDPASLARWQRETMASLATVLTRIEGRRE